MSKSKGIIFSITGIIIVSLFLIVYTFGYVLIKIKGNENSILSSFTSKKVSVAYNEISNTSNGETISPGYEFIKVFTATNDGNVAVNYHIYLDNVENEFVRTQDITYTLYRSELNKTIDTSSLSDSNIVATGTFPTTDAYIKFNEEIEVPNNYYTYALKINYAKTTESQDEDDGHIFSFRVQLYIDLINPFSDNTNLLTYNILNNAMEEKNGTILTATPATTPAVAGSTAKEKELSVTSDDYGTSYYYRGNVGDNYVNFAGMCWRIVRIEGDGSVKLTLAAQKECSEITDSDTGTALIGSGNYGYTQGKVTNSSGQQSTSDIVVADYLNGKTDKDNSMKTQLDAWLESGEIDKTKLKQDNWCLGNLTDVYDENGTLLTDSKNDLMYNETSFYYDTYRRLYGQGTTRYATLKCSGENYETYSSYIGALTVDEVVFAGLQIFSYNYDHYLIINEENIAWRTLSLSFFHPVIQSDIGYTVNSSRGYLDGVTGMISSNFDFRPSIVLKSNTTISKGTGTQTDPYIVE